MVNFTPPQVAVPDTAPDDPRLGLLLGRKVGDHTAPKVAIIGFPSDEGVRTNGGRVGAAKAPDAIRHAFYRLTPDAEHADAFRDVVEHTRDGGNLAISGRVEQDQELLGDVVGGFLSQNVLPIIIGGGHETAYGHFLGYVKADQEIAILNWDAHTDVRELKEGKAHSGSPFRQALLHPSQKCRHYRVAGLLPYAVSRSHLDFIAKHGGQYDWKDALSRERIDEIYRSFSSPVMASFDLDAVDQSYAPGVSAPAVNGLSADLWLYAAYRAGKCPSVKSLDLVELNPQFDRDNQTARLAALTLWFFLKGLSER
ncbi:MAG: formimidoylglutamase [Nitrospirales bacterium]